MGYILYPRYDSRKSFYGKAMVEERDNKKRLYSYNTLVAKVIYEDKTIYKYLGYYSATTTRHQNEFFKQEGLSENEIKELKKNGELVV